MIGNLLEASIGVAPSKNFDFGLIANPLQASCAHPTFLQESQLRAGSPPN